jgi:hypothetical protein
MLLCPLFDFHMPGSGSQGFRHGEQCPDPPDIARHARENGGNPTLDRIFFFLQF